MFDPKEPLDRIEGESLNANTALRDYFAMGAGRSLRKLLAEYDRRVADESLTSPTTRWTTLSGWSCKYHWVARVKAHLEILYKEEEIYWKERAREIREEDNRQSNRLRKLVDRVLDEGASFVRTKRKLIKGENGLPDREVVTIGLKIGEVMRALELASRLQRLSAEIADPTRRVEVEVNKELEKVLTQLEENLDDDTFNRVLAAIAGEEETGKTETN